MDRPTSSSSNGFETKIKTEENYFQWRIENLEWASKDEFIKDSMRLTVVVGETFEQKWKVKFYFAKEGEGGGGGGGGEASTQQNVPQAVESPPPPTVPLQNNAPPPPQNAGQQQQQRQAQPQNAPPPPARQQQGQLVVHSVGGLRVAPPPPAAAQAQQPAQEVRPQNVPPPPAGQQHQRQAPRPGPPQYAPLPPPPPAAHQPPQARPQYRRVVAGDFRNLYAQLAVPPALQGPLPLYNALAPPPPPPIEPPVFHLVACQNLPLPRVNLNPPTINLTSLSSSYLDLHCQFEDNSGRCRPSALSSPHVPPPPPPFCSQRLQVFIKKLAGGGDFYYDSDLEPKLENTTRGGFRIPKLIKIGPSSSSSPSSSPQELDQSFRLVDDALWIEMKLTLSKICESGSSGGSGVAAAADREDHHLTSGIHSVVSDVLLSSAEGGSYSDSVTLCSGGGGGGGGASGSNGADVEVEMTSVSSSKAILAVRSPTLAGMFLKNPAEERTVLDASPRVFDILVNYLHTGKLPIQGFSSHSEILKVAAAAFKYGIHELFRYCDEILVADHCTMASASLLLVKAREGRLVKSANAIMEYITIHANNNQTRWVEGGGGGGSGLDQREFPGILNHNFTLGEILTTGVLKDVYPLNWRISNFLKLVTTTDPGIGGSPSPPVTFRNRKITGCPFNSNVEAGWGLQLSVTKIGNDVRLSLVCKLESSVPVTSSAAAAPVHFCLLIDAQDRRNREQKFWTTIKPLEATSKWSRLFKIPHLPIADEQGSLNLNLTLVVLKPATTHYSNNTAAAIDVCKTLRSFRQRSVESLYKALESLYSSLPVFTDVVIISKEGHEFYAHWRFLAGRVPTFHSMYHSGMEERRSGVVKLVDVSSNGVLVLLHYVYTGRILASKFGTAADILDVANVAEKYELRELREYCDATLASKVNLVNAGELMAAAATYGLSKALVAMQTYVKSRARNGSMDYADILVGLPIP